MMEKKNLKIVSLALSIANLAILFVMNYAKVSLWGFSEGISFFDATKASALLWVLIFIPIIMIALPYVGDAVKKYESMLNLVLPIVGLLLHVLLFFYIKGQVGALGFSGVDIKAGLGFYVNIVVYLAWIVVNVMASKGVDLGNAKLNDFVNKAADTASSTTDKVVKTVDKTVDNIKNKD